MSLFRDCSDPEAKASQAGRKPVLWPGRWTDVWSLKTALPQKLCGSRVSQKLLASVVHTLTCADCPQRSLEPRWLLRNLRQKPLGPCRHLSSGPEGGWLPGAENHAVSEALWLSPVPEAASLCSPHFHLQTARRGVPEQKWLSRNLRQKPPGPGGQLSSGPKGGWLSLSGYFCWSILIINNIELASALKIRKTCSSVYLRVYTENIGLKLKDFL